MPIPLDPFRVVIVGAGFGGLACAKALAGAPVDVTVVDRRNHNVFQPLLYQVATAALSPADVAEPIRKILGRHRNVRVRLGSVEGVDLENRRVLLGDGQALPWDRLVIGTGSDYDYFGHDEWRAHAPGLKSIHEARTIRQRLLLAFERAEAEPDKDVRRALLTTIAVGGGPTGVEMAGAVIELGRDMVARDFRRIAPEEVRVLLVEAGPRLLAAFPEGLAAYARRRLERAGVEVLLGRRVERIEEDGAVIAGEWVPAGCVVWGAGVKASPAGLWLGLAPQGRDGRVPVDGLLRVVGLAGAEGDVFALGDTARCLDATGRPLPALAQVAKQQGRYLGLALRAAARGDAPAGPFRFHDRGNAAVIGRHAAVFDFGRWQMKGFLAWLLWAAVHVMLLVNLEKRVLVSIQWAWRYATRQRGARLIDETDLAGRPHEACSSRRGEPG
jgi:NADH dehydrogenase